jgi:hypothetical protein
MSFLKKITNVVTRPVSSIASEVGRVADRAKSDILPVAAGIATGGASLAFLPLSDDGAIGRATGGLGSTAANIYGSLGPGGALSAGLGNLGGQDVMYDDRHDMVIQQAPQTDAGADSLMGSVLGLIGGMLAPAQQRPTVAETPQVGQNAPQIVQAPQSQGMSPALLFGIGGGLLALVALIVVSGKK